MELSRFFALYHEQDISRYDAVSLKNHDHGMSAERWEFFRYRDFSPTSDKDAAKKRVEAVLRLLTQRLEAGRGRGSKYQAQRGGKLACAAGRSSLHMLQVVGATLDRPVTTNIASLWIVRPDGHRIPIHASRQTKTPNAGGIA
jgi:hypothetical protein